MNKIREQIRKILNESSENKMDAILDKISTYGIDALTDEEVDFLDQASKNEKPDQYEQPIQTYPSEEKVKAFMDQEMLNIDIEVYNLPILFGKSVVETEAVCYVRDDDIMFLHVENINTSLINRLAIFEEFFNEIKDGTGLKVDSDVASGFAKWFEEYSGKEIYEIKFMIRGVDLEQEDD